MGKQQKPPKSAGPSLGKGKVTPVQIAFLVHRYLADNGMSATLASFQSEAADLFGKTRSRQAPRGLLGLAEILDDYVSLKEQRIAVGQEQQRVDALLRGIHDAVQAYRSETGISKPVHHAFPSPPQSEPTLPAPPSTPAMASVCRIPSANPASGSIMHNIALPGSSSAVITLQSSTTKTPISGASRGDKRKDSKPALKALAAPKKHRAQRRADASMMEDSSGLSPSADFTSNILCAVPARDSTAAIQQKTVLPLEGSSVSKNPFSLLPNPSASSSSPKTPQQTPSITAVTSVSQSTGVSTSKELTTTKCAILSSKTVVVSPFKKECYYAVEKSCCISSSPMKTNQRRGGKRDCVKGRLNFEDPDLPTRSDIPAAVESPSSSGDKKVEDAFDFDLSDFDVDFSFAELLFNVDFECEELQESCQPAYNFSADSITGSQGDTGSGCAKTGQDASSSYLPSLPEIISKEGMDYSGVLGDSVTSVKTITKCIKIVSPAKGARSTCLEPLKSQAC